ncbi:MAG: hypothetical protein ACI4I9_05865 [Porcipelethomonas sp.]
MKISYSGATEKEKANNRRFLVLSIVIACLAVVYFGYHTFSFSFNGYNSKIKTEFSVYETGLLESELGVIFPENTSVEKAKYISGKSPVLMVWISGIDDFDEFISEYTGFSPENYKNVVMQINENESSAARYYSVLKDGDSDPSECYIYRLPEDESWTAYLVENDVTYDEVGAMFQTGGNVT